ncbi:MAG: hypothetical protein HW421_4033 [Ignavibacteria bacterium]|nr:hypothetical protein [Ignavibacteria bacterium]
MEAIVKNLTEHFVWGVTKYEFVSASSSILYPLILAIFYKIFNLGQYSNFILDLFLAILFLFIVYKIFIREGLSKSKSAIITSSFIILTPLISNIFVGLEHICQIVINLCFFYFITRFLTTDPKEKIAATNYLIIIIFSILTTAVRYEGLFIIASAFLLLLFRKRFGTALIVLISGSLPILVFGFISIANQNYLLPNSLLMKSSLSMSGFSTALFKDFGIKVVMQILKFGYVLSMILTSITLLYLSAKSEKNIFNKISIYNMLFIIVLILHLQYSFILTYTSMRYEFYLIGLFIFIIYNSLISFTKQKPKVPKFLYNRIVIIALLIIMIAPIFSSVLKLYIKIPRISNNIYCQQYQMGKFIEKHYQYKNTIANDIGAVDYFGNSKNIDLEGLGSVEIVKAKRAGKFDSGFIDEISRKNNTEMIVIFKCWYENKIPKNWLEVASWRIPDNYICIDEIVHFFAIDSSKAKTLKSNLKQYEKELPSKVEVKY